MAILHLSTNIDIQATPATVWSILTDLKAFPSWNPFLTEASGPLDVGQQLSIRAGGMAFRPTVTHCIPKQRIAWLGKFWFKGLFDGIHSFRLEALPNGYVRFHHEEHFSGLLVGLFKKKLNTETRAGFEAMNKALKARAEQLAVTH